MSQNNDILPNCVQHAKAMGEVEEKWRKKMSDVGIKPITDKKKIDSLEKVLSMKCISKETAKKAETVDAIPITDFYRMISNVKLDCDDDSKFSSEYFDGYGDGTRNAIVEMVQALCGDCDGDCDEFWEKYLFWSKENETY